jgi:ribosomal protein L17
MLEDTEQFHAPLESLIPECTESASTLEDKACLTVEILQYWDVHLHYQGSIKETSQKAREVRQHLGKLLFHLKQVLAKPGRDGRWSSFLKEHSIPRATADRLVVRHQRSLDPDANRLNEAISEPTAEQVEKLFNSVWPRLRRVLVTPGSIYQFVLAVASASNNPCFEVREEGILARKPGTESANSSPRIDAAPETDSGSESVVANAPAAASSATKHPIAYCDDAFVECL